MMDLYFKLKAIDLVIGLGVWLLVVLGSVAASMLAWWHRRRARRWNEAADRQPPTRRW